MSSQTNIPSSSGNHVADMKASFELLERDLQNREYLLERGKRQLDQDKARFEQEKGDLVGAKQEFDDRMQRWLQRLKNVADVQ